ncbi:Recombinase NinB [uncultured Caudovirales phage]|uniref:Recombinase NinB n=1 Tax=uncultured Caudovirales phage TaxID=2100421 RepID=A0A6J5KHV9_9CAUD|nr:Recombinase NinB [uncultured Caudovirales phage]
MQCVKQAPDGYCVEVKPKTRSLEQNRRMWAMLGEIASQVIWYGKTLSPENWKDIFSAALKKQDVVPGIDGGFVVMGQSTSKMTIKEMLDLQDLMSAFGAERNVRWSDSCHG